ncbi:hypothetical protein IMZ31_22625 (plasmid) [Pontibacillus sp. ALD_SL1]|uniref:hypothetical protein n=1 Tax=Pontibacillus sp. ALD_SL1 TaxID=2777185 RepID=UPI001A97C259|nr:hypothetical protein [Pontibacillus sp. ALD_SL1]QST02252.1 hypothetical protein IMZ31_22625 [Pontibacillus sp. ALD_SL1]
MTMFSTFKDHSHILPLRNAYKKASEEIEKASGLYLTLNPSTNSLMISLPEHLEHPLVQSILTVFFDLSSEIERKENAFHLKGYHTQNAHLALILLSELSYPRHVVS